MRCQWDAPRKIRQYNVIKSVKHQPAHRFRTDNALPALVRPPASHKPDTPPRLGAKACAPCHTPRRRPSHAKPTPVASRSDAGREERRRRSPLKPTPVAFAGDRSRNSKRRPSPEPTTKTPAASALGGSRFSESLPMRMYGISFAIAQEVQRKAPAGLLARAGRIRGWGRGRSRRRRCRAAFGRVPYTLRPLRRLRSYRGGCRIPNSIAEQTGTCSASKGRVFNQSKGRKCLRAFRFCSPQKFRF